LAAALRQLLPIPPRAVASLPTMPDRYYGLAADNRTYVWATQDDATFGPQTVHLWDTVAGKEQLAFEGPAYNPRHGELNDRYQALSPCRDYLVLYDWTRKTVRCWDAATGAEHVTLPGGSWCMSEDDQWLALESEDGRAVNVWDMPSKRQKLRIVCSQDWPEAPGHCRGKCFSPGGQALAVGVGADVQLWDMNSVRMTSSLPCGAGRIPLLAFSPDGRMLAACCFLRDSKSTEGKLTFWDGVSGQLRASITLSSARDPHEFQMRFNADGRKLFFGIWYNTYRVADLMRLTHLDLDDRKNGLYAPDDDTMLSRDPAWPTPLSAASPDGRYLARYDRESGDVVLVSGAGEKILRTIDRANERLAYLTFSPESGSLIVGTVATAPTTPTPTWTERLLLALGVVENLPATSSSKWSFGARRRGRWTKRCKGLPADVFSRMARSW
jgi:WD40 repeat protein